MRPHTHTPLGATHTPLGATHTPLGATHTPLGATHKPLDATLTLPFAQHYFDFYSSCGFFISSAVTFVRNEKSE